MKRQIVFLMALFVIFVGSGLSTAHADPMVMEKLPLLAGDWCDEKGNVVLRIHDGYLNDCRIVDLNVADSIKNGGAKVSIEEATGVRQIFFYTNVNGEISDHLGLEDGTPLYRNFPYWHVTIGGVHLGSTPEDIVQAFGKPDAVQKRTGYSPRQGDIALVYRKKGLEFGVNSMSNTVRYIKLSPQSAIVWDGMKNRDGGFKLYKEKYAPNAPIGYGEYFDWDNGYITLTNEQHF